jgi:TetR/AcrR family transcriptional repressor of nem operon
MDVGSKILSREGKVMTKGEETRQHIIVAAASLFNQRGYAGCSMGDVMEATGLEKGGLYRHFKSKEELAAEALAYSVGESVRLRVQAIDPTADALTSLRAYIERFDKVPSAVAGGCPLMNAAIEHDDGNVALRAVARSSFASWKERLVALVEQGKRERVIQRKADPAWLADTIIATLEGALMLSRIQRSQEPMRHAQQSLLIVLDSVAAKD